MRVAAGSLLTLLVACLAGLGSAEPAAAKRPNLILITTDDQPIGTFTPELMPRTHRRLVAEGTYFEQAAVVVPLCCPSRASMLTGQYPHNTGVVTNRPGYGALKLPRNVLPRWLQAAGYRTAHVGKWLHGYELLHGRRPAPGWDHWFTQLPPRRYYDYRVSDDGRLLRRGTARRDHATEVMTRHASRWLRRVLPRPKPVFLQLDYYAPHRGAGHGTARCIGAAQPSPGDEDAWAGAQAPRVPSFNEPDVSDKPGWVRRRQLDEREISNIDRRYRCTIASLMGVDRGIDRIFGQLERAGELGNTAVAFISDNGYMFGEHRLKGGKSRAWEESVRTPLALRLPPRMGTQAPTFDGAVASIDLVPTLLGLAGADPCIRKRCRRLDGRSLLAPALGGDTSVFDNRAILIEMDDSDTDDPRIFPCAFAALRTTRDVFIRNYIVPSEADGRCERRTVMEHYEIDRDPYQLENVHGGVGEALLMEEVMLANRLEALASCSGVAGRDAAGKRPYCE